MRSFLLSYLVSHVIINYFMYYVVGLGNPGEEYKETRHNVGFLMLDYFVESEKFPTPLLDKKVSGLVSLRKIDDEEVMVHYPDTYMNNSGRAVAKLVIKKELKNLIVVHDDVALPLGTIRVSFGRGSGGQNGIKSIIATMGSSDFVRIRVGVAPKVTEANSERPAGVPGAKLAGYVLGKFTKTEQAVLPEIAKRVGECLLVIFKKGHVEAMNRFN